MTPDQIDQIIAKYGRPAFELALRQVYIDAGYGAFATIAFVVGALAFGIFAVRKYRTYRRFRDGGGASFETEDDLAAYICGFVAGMLAICALLTFGSVLTLLNPEFAALQKLLSTVK